MKRNLKYKIGDRVSCVEPNINMPELVGMVGTVIQLNYSDSMYICRVHFDNTELRIWCNVEPGTKLGRLLAGVEND